MSTGLWAQSHACIRASPRMDIDLKRYAKMGLHVVPSLLCNRYLYIMVSASRTLPLLVLLAGFSFSSATGAAVVKMSGSGLCHPTQSSWYERTKNYQAFESLEDCLASGGKLPQGVSRVSLKGSQEQSDERQNYKRSTFGHGWDDADGDCQDSRAEVLIATSTTQVRFADNKRCRVITGRWISPFTNRVIQNGDDIEIDHVFSPLVTRNILAST